ncbi:MAG: hypothetical protein ACLRSW_00540 [Christensenellaceae bacterium]
MLCGTPETKRGTLVNYLRKNAVNNMMYICTQTEEGAKFASLDYRVLESKGRYSLAEVRRCTRAGRIRSACRWRGFPIPFTGTCATGALWRRRASLRFGHILFLYSSRNEGTPALHGISACGGNALKAFDVASAVEITENFVKRERSYFTVKCV